MTKVLIVDDSPLIRVLIKRIVAQRSVEALEAGSAEEAVAAYKKEKPNIVFMDIIMGEKNGVDALRDIIAFDPDAVVVMVTSIGAQDPIIRETVEYGASGFISKPFKSEEILAVIDKYKGQPSH